MGGYSSDVSGGYSNRAYLMRCDVGALGSSGCGSLVWIRIANLNYAREGECKITQTIVYVYYEGVLIGYKMWMPKV